MTLISRLVFFQTKNTENKSSGRITLSEISIVIPVKDNQQGINNYLENFILTQTTGDFPKEIIIVDNNSRIPILVSERYYIPGLIIRILLCNKKGPAAARNRGIKNARGKWILFNDSDCIPTPTLLIRYLQADNFSLAYAGNIKSLKNCLFSRYYESQEILIPLKTINSNNELVPQYLITANSLVWTEALISVGGFNESITIAGGEDIDLGLRISRLGRLSYAFESLALHNFECGFKAFCNRFYRYGIGNRIVEHLWGTNMYPRPFLPNKISIFNFIAAFMQYLFLIFGYRVMDVKIKDKI